MSRMITKLSVSSVIISLLVICTLAFNSYSEEKSKKIDASLKKKVAVFLTQRGHGNIDLLDGDISSIQNGYFLKAEGIDKKTNKKYYMEMVCTTSYSDWALLAINEEGVKSQGNKK